MEPINPKNLTPLPPFPTREWGGQSLSTTRREVWREVFMSLQTVSKRNGCSMATFMQQKRYQLSFSTILARQRFGHGATD